MIPPHETEALLAATRSRGEVKALGARVDRDPALREAMLRLARRRGVEVAPDWPGKRLVRALRGREEEARRRRNPVRRDEAFRCVHCGRDVPPGGARVRDHCPHCLRGLHVDRVPGDRAAGCGGVMDPVGFELAGRAGVVVRWRCRRCGATFRGRAHPDDAVPPSLDPADLGVEAAPRPPRDPARTLPARVLEAIRVHRMWAPGDAVLVAVSGGLDSTVLLELLARLRRAHGGRLLVASVDHGLRPEAVAEVAQVGRRARALGLPFFAISLDLAPGANLQARAREARRAALLRVAEREGASRVATGHHLDDQAETVLQRLLRGSGGTGLAAMRPVAGPWVRPLLGEPRARLRAWAEREGLSWVEDPTNATSQRGRLRALMPELDRVRGGGAARALARSARLLAREDEFLEELAARELDRLGGTEGLDVAGLAALHPALRLRVLRRLAGPPAPPAAALETALSWTPREGARIDLGAGRRLVVRAGRLVVEQGGGT